MEPWRMKINMSMVPLRKTRILQSKFNRNQANEMLKTVLSNMDPHGVRFLACIHSRTAAGSWPKAAVTLSLNPLLPCRPADQPWRRTGLSPTRSQ